MKWMAEWSAGMQETGNALIHGDNLTDLMLLTKTHAGSVKCAYLDPPYNNGERYQHYSDSMGHEDWLQAITARLEQIKTLLCEDGSVWILIDQNVRQTPPFMAGKNSATLCCTQYSHIR